MAKVKVKVSGVKKLNRRLRDLQGSISADSPALKAAMLKSCLLVRAESQKLTPVVTGNLKNSAYTDIRPGKTMIKGVIGYSAAYAPFVHENTRAGKTGGVSPSGKPYKRWSKVGEWKFLETAIKRNESRIREFFRVAVMEILGR